MALFSVKPTRSTRNQDAAVLSKMQQPKMSGVVSVKGGKSLIGRIKEIEMLVNMKLGKYDSDYLVLRTEEEVKEYVYQLIQKEWAVLDFETSGLDPLNDVIAGTVLYSKGQKPCYIPQNHESYVTNVRYESQVSDAFVREQLQRIKDSKVKLAYDNAKFDIRMGKHYLGIEMPCDWDTDVAAHMLNENEPYFALKKLHFKYCDSKDDFAYSYSDLFDNIPFTLIPIKTGYLYAAGDGPKTDELKDFQMQYLNAEKLPGVWNVCSTIEFPLIPVTAAMEDHGVALDVPYSKELSVKYHALKEKYAQKYENELAKVQPQIDLWVQQNPNTREASLLRVPVKSSSPQQLSVLLYDVLRLPVVDKKKPRGTGEGILEKLDHSICKCIVNSRKVEKLLSTYIDKMPNEINQRTGMIHANFHQNGTVTGRYSSSDPNMQNIPSKNKDIRKMFTAGPEHYFVSCDYSQQEPRILCYVSKDESLRHAYIVGKDLYSTCAAQVFKVSYEDCLEHFADGTENPDGAKRRFFCKSVILGLMYGRSAGEIAKQCGISQREAQKIIDDFYQSYPKVREWMDWLLDFGRQHGFVETIAGRKRRLPDLQLADYEFRYTKETKQKHFDPLDFSSVDEVAVDQDIIDNYLHQLGNARGYKQINNIIRAARDNGIIITDNTERIARAERQAVNAVIQGSAADMTKKAMIRMEYDEALNQIGTVSALSVHDELIMRTPRSSIVEATQRIAEIMVDTAKEMVPIEIKWKCDTIVTERWYGEPVKVSA